MSGLFGKDLALEWLRSQWKAKEMKRHVFVCRPQTSMVTHKIFQVDESKLGPDVLIFTDFMFSLELWRRCPTPPLRCCSVPLKIKRISKSWTRRWWKKAFSSLYIIPNSIPHICHFFYRQNFWIIKFTPKNANFSRKICKKRHFFA